jgi:hypothetical protein
MKTIHLIYVSSWILHLPQPILSSLSCAPRVGILWMLMCFPQHRVLKSLLTFLDFVLGIPRGLYQHPHPFSSPKILSNPEPYSTSLLTLSIIQSPKKESTCIVVNMIVAIKLNEDKYHIVIKNNIQEISHLLSLIHRLI